MKYKFLYCVCFLSLLVSCNGGDKKPVRYEMVKEWSPISNLKIGNPTGIGVDSNQNIFIFHRANREWPLIGAMPSDFIKEQTIIVLNRNGKLLNSWGENQFLMPHGLTIDEKDNVWVSDVGLHQIFKFSKDGKLLMTIGVAKVVGSDALHFNRPTDIAIAKDGSFYVSDGYGNSRIVKFSAKGKYLLEWGKKGMGVGEFNIPHSITLDKDGNVYVADRENKRIEVFNDKGKFLREIKNKAFGNICAVYYNEVSKQLIAIDDEVSWFGLKHNGSNVFIINIDGSIADQFGKAEFKAVGLKGWFHDVIADKYGNIYVGDILENKVWKYVRKERVNKN
ncbi:peptidyl-alpha-hydroxyglycine alpha-amidating lyase family protein [Pedobacter frigiditerrae]|uniref:peptidyl-alpha-hydroxyglycine alpha-amidating lyase family protein n=1 Tax=Pedobacter frigiditerrae TaxID=2530452 RepID=UPI002930D018|nr:peptidyl-alpha-hydroxyglycine alpha-amidating lyase family protein [Pedobacter frigiditerrae]